MYAVVETEVDASEEEAVIAAEGAVGAFVDLAVYYFVDAAVDEDVEDFVVAPVDAAVDVILDTAIDAAVNVKALVFSTVVN